MQASIQKAQQIIVDATGHITGRLCSKIAKLTLNGNRVVVLNAEKALLSGSRSSIMKEWEEWLEVGSITNPIQGPYHPRTPERIIKRTVRGMLPMRKPKGDNALKRLRVFNGIPEQYKNSKPIGFDDARATKPVAFYTPVGEVAKLIGWKG